MKWAGVKSKESSGDMGRGSMSITEPQAKVATRRVIDEAALPQIDADDFARRFALRAERLMWLLGAGASASAGLPTAIDMVWEFKQKLFVSQRKVSRQTVTDLSNSVVRMKLQDHIDSLGHLPCDGDPNEYAALFEEVYSSEADRRVYMDAKMAGAKPSYGHLALAILMRAQRTRLVWTTNFDALVADACAKIYDTTGSLTTVDLDAPSRAAQVIDDERWPLEVKLHGDFRSRSLKNTSDELRQQDALLRKKLIDSCQRFGLVVVGYSGRDDSVMNAFDEALQFQGVFPAGLFWLHRGEYPPLPRVRQLLTKADEKGIETALVPIENFDEVLRDLIRLIDDIDTTELDAFAKERPRWSSAPRPAGRTSWPVVRLNALPVILRPSVCRRIDCNIGGTAEVREAIEQAGVNAIAARSRTGVLAFGADADLRTSFKAYGIREFDVHTLEVKRQKYDSNERGLLREALTNALVRRCGLKAIRRRNTDLLTPVNSEESTWKPLKKLVGSITGKIDNNQELGWQEGIGIRLDWADDRLWLLIEPRTVFDGVTDDNKMTAASFSRARTVKRYNRDLNELFEFWAQHLAQNGVELRALGISDGIDAIYKLSPITGFSRRIGA